MMLPTNPLTGGTTVKHSRNVPMGIAYKYSNTPMTFFPPNNAYRPLAIARMDAVLHVINSGKTPPML
jgi:hypothetical protein